MGRLIAYAFMFLPLLYLGRTQRCLDIVSEYASTAGTPQLEMQTRLMLAVCYSHLDRVDDGRRLVGALIDSDIDEWRIAHLALRLQLALL
jgi:hypothetical protein